MQILRWIRIKDPHEKLRRVLFSEEVIGLRK